MSGGFFRGTSADQDTRFSNKQAKLLKSQKFAPELEHLVDMSKVKMDVIRPWIATRATELLGFEDEVLINFVYGLLDGKLVDGRQIQIQLTGFMEKNTGKFMKELWGLLLSAQKNASGVPQQFLDAKEEETRKKKAEADRITQEIQRRKEKEKEIRESEQEKQKRMDGEVDVLRPVNASSDAVPKHLMANASNISPEEERDLDRKHSSRRKRRHSTSPYSDDHSPSSKWSTPSATRSSSKSFSNSRSYSEEGRKSRSISVSPRSRRRSVSHEKRHLSSPKHSISPRRKRSPWIPGSPSRRRSPHSRRRSIPRSHHRTPSPVQLRSPVRRRSPSLLRHRSPSPRRRRAPSPLRRRSPSPLRRRSPPLMRRRLPIQVSRRSPSPSRRRFPSVWRRSRSPSRRRSPSPLRRRSPLPASPKHHRSLRSPRRQSPLHSPRRHAVDSQNSPRQRNRSRSPYKSQSPSYQSRRSLSRDRVNGVDSRRYRDDYASQRVRGKRSPLRNSLERDEAEQPDSGRQVLDSASRQRPISLRSPQRDPRDQNDARNMHTLSDLQETSPNKSEYPSFVRGMNPSGNSSSESPPRETGIRTACHDIPETSREEEDLRHARQSARHKTDTLHNKSKDSPAYAGPKKFSAKGFDSEEYSPDRPALKQSGEGPVSIELRKKEHDKSDMDFTDGRTRQVSHSSEEVEYGPGRVVEESISLDIVHDERLSAKKLSRDAASSLDERPSNEQDLLKRSHSREEYRLDDKKRPRLKDDEYSARHETDSVLKNRKMGERNRVGPVDSDSEDNETYKNQNLEKRSIKKPEHPKEAYGDEDGYDSQRDDRKEAKRRKKEEKRLRKEEKRRRREERHRRREERHAGKLKAKYMDTVTPPPDYEKNYNAADDSDGDVATRGDSHPSDNEETESEQKKLEIELRKKALESLRAKKGTSH